MKGNPKTLPVPTNTQFSAHYDGGGNIVLTVREEGERNLRREAPDDVQAHVEDASSRCRAHTQLQNDEREPRFPIIAEAFRFTGTFMGVFLLLFISMNYQSFSQVFRAALLPQAQEEERAQLEAMTDSLLRRAPHDTGRKIPSAPRLPTAGMDPGTLHRQMAVAPPDNRLIVPKIGKNIPLVSLSGAAIDREDWTMFEKDVQDALRFGVVHYPGTAEPGVHGNVFITGHSSYYPWDSGRYKDVFALLPTLEIGDEYSIYYEGDLHRYRITNKYEVSPKDVSVLDQPQDRFMSILMTCTPLGTTLKRLILEADEIDPFSGEFVVVEDAPDPERSRRVAEPGVGGELPV
jgi:LPXTG-site transpeptidase (sortase) family protein